MAGLREGIPGPGRDDLPGGQQIGYRRKGSVKEGTLGLRREE